MCWFESLCSCVEISIFKLGQSWSMHHHIAGQQILQFAQNGFSGMLPDHGFNHQCSVDIYDDVGRQIIETEKGFREASRTQQYLE